VAYPAADITGGNPRLFSLIVLYECSLRLFRLAHFRRLNFQRALADTTAESKTSVKHADHGEVFSVAYRRMLSGHAMPAISAWQTLGREHGVAINVKSSELLADVQ
jgi:hypothetical protein